MKNQNQKGIASALAIIIVIIIGIIAIGGVLTYRYWSASEEVKVPEKKVEIEKESVEDILAKAENIGPVQYEIVSTISMTGVPQEVTTIVTMKVWQKMPYMRMDSTTAGTTTIMIVRPDAVYFYDASKDKYLKMTPEEMATKFTQKSFTELSKEIKESGTLKELGTEIIDGKLTTIIEYSITVEETIITQKLWIWNEKGVPLKAESTTGMGEIVTTTKMEYKNFVFEDIPDSVFEVPEDKIIK